MNPSSFHQVAFAGCITLAIMAIVRVDPAGAGSWRPVTEAGVTYQPERGPLEPYGHTEHWRWGGALGAVREIGSLGSVGPVLVGSANENDFALGAGVRWTREIIPGWDVLVTPGFVAHDLMEEDRNPFPGYFGEFGVSYRRILTLAARRESIRREVRSVLAEDVPPYKVTSHVWRIETRLGKAPGAMVLGLAAASALVLIVGRTTND